VGEPGWFTATAGDDGPLPRRLRDPDGNGLELCWDRPFGNWPRDAKGELQMVTQPLDLNSLFHEAH
jgi:catechol-2,3-dioxygenase